MKSIILTQVITTRVSDDTTVAPIVLPIARIENATPQVMTWWTKGKPESRTLTKIEKVNGDYVYVTESVDAVNAIINYGGKGTDYLADTTRLDFWEKERMSPDWENIPSGHLRETIDRWMEECGVKHRAVARQDDWHDRHLAPR